MPNRPYGYYVIEKGANKQFGRYFCGERCNDEKTRGLSLACGLQKTILL